MPNASVSTAVTERAGARRSELKLKRRSASMLPIPPPPIRFVVQRVQDPRIHRPTVRSAGAYPGRSVTTTIRRSSGSSTHKRR